MGMSPMSPPYSSAGSYHQPTMTSPFSTSSPVFTPRSSTSPLSSNHPSSIYQRSLSPSSIREKPLDLIKEKENHVAQDLSLNSAKQRLPLSLRSPSDSNIKRSKSSSPPTSLKHDSPSSWRPW